jgi:tetratricopeptide (TPR) repeat protein
MAAFAWSLEPGSSLARLPSENRSTRRSTIDGMMKNTCIRFPGSCSRFIAVVLGLIGSGFTPAPPAGAEPDQQVQWCNGDDQATPDQIIRGCTALIRSGEYSGSDLAVIFTNRGSAYDDKRDEDRAIADHNRAIKLDPKLDLAFNNRANAYGRKGEVDRALVDYDQAIKLNPKFATAYNNRGNTWRDDKRDNVRAISDYDQAIRFNPKFADAYNNRGIAHDNLGNHDRAVADFSSAIQIDPKFSLAYNNRGLQYRDKGDYAAAFTDFDAAIAINPRYANAYRNRGNAYAKKGDYDRAIVDLTTALGIKPEDTEAIVSRGIAYGKTGDYDRAIADYDRIIAANQQDLPALSNRGYTRFYRGDFAEAAADLLRITPLDNYPYPGLFRFLALSRVGQAVPDLEPVAQRLKNRDWPFAVLELYLGRSDPAAVLAAAQKLEERCQAQFYVGEWQLVQGDRTNARQRFEEAASICPKSFIEYTGAQAELRRLGP